MTERLAPSKLLTAYINEKYPGAHVLYDATIPFGASLNGTPVFIIWYSPARAERIQQLNTVDEVARFMRDEKIQLVLWDMASASRAGDTRSLLRTYLSRFGLPEHKVGGIVLYRLTDEEQAYKEAYSVTPASHALTVSSQSRSMTTFPTHGASMARYTVQFSCRSAAGNFIAQVNWNVGAPYYRQVGCDTADIHFEESLPVPMGATTGEVIVSVNGDTEAELTQIKIETK